MKKSITLLLFIAVYTFVCGQNTTADTMYIGDRDPIYYYWDTNWVDHYFFPAGSNDSLKWEIREWAYTCAQPEHARYCYTDSALRIIGVAAVLNIYEYDDYNNWYRQYDPLVWEHMKKEYFCLYEIDSNTNEMIQLKKAEINIKQKFRHYHEMNVNGPQCVSHIFPIYESYFDEPVTVHDSFYVSVTFNNNYNREPDGSERTRNGIFVQFFTALVDIINAVPSAYSLDYAPNPSHARFRFTRIAGEVWPPFPLPHDTIWHIENGGDLYPEGFYFIFPIIDTSRNVPQVINCDVPTGLTTAYASPEVCLFTWDKNGGSQWELAVAEEGLTPEEGVVMACSSTLKAVNGLDSGRCYEAWVRTVCNDTTRSEWSQSVHFCTNDGQTDIITAPDSYTQLYPNPTNGSITIYSAFRMSKIEVFGINGTLLLNTKTDGMSTNVDLTELPAGAYIVRIHTNNGIATKRLVKK